MRDAKKSEIPVPRESSAIVAIFSILPIAHSARVNYFVSLSEHHAPPPEETPMFARLLGAAALVLLLNSSAPASLITNGDFEAGNVGFISDYSFQPPPNIAAGEYFVGPSSQAWNGNFNINTVDHTTGAGNMLMFNGATTAGVVAWQSQPLSLPAVADYTFSFWATSLFDQSPATLQLTVQDGVSPETVVGTFNLSSNVNSWTNFTVTQNTVPFSGPVTFRIYDTNLAPTGNDFALDDITLTATAVPEPATLAVLGFGLAGIGGYIRRRKAVATA